MLPHQTQIKICPYISLGINSHSQIALVKLGKRKLTRLVLATCEMPSSRQCQESHLSAPQRPQPGLLQLALLLQDNGQVVHQDERVRVLGSQLGLVAFQCSALETFCLAARDGALRWWNIGNPSSGPMGHGKGRISQQRPHWTSGEKNTIPSHQALWLLTLLANSHETTLGRPRRWLRLGWSVIISTIVKRPPK